MLINVDNYFITAFGDLIKYVFIETLDFQLEIDTPETHLRVCLINGAWAMFEIWIENEVIVLFRLLQSD